MHSMAVAVPANEGGGLAGAGRQFVGLRPSQDPSTIKPKVKGDNMMDFAIHLEARDPARNIWRAYSMMGGQDLFGDWVVVLSYGRIGAKGRTKTVTLPDKEATCRYVQQCLKKRESAPKRIGIGYKVIRATGLWEEFIESRNA